MPRLIIPGNYQSTATKFLPYDAAGLEYWGMYDGSAARCAVNHAHGKPDALLVGAPTFNAQDVQIATSAAYIQTQALQTADTTLIAVVRMPDDNAGVRPIIANGPSPGVAPPPATARGAALTLNSGTTAGDGFDSLSMSTSVNNAGADVAFNATLANNVPINQWVCVAGRYDSSTKGYKAINLTTGASAVATGAYPAALASSPYRVGCDYAPGSLNGRIAMAAIYSTAKSDAELSALYAKLKAYYASRGMAI